MAAAAGAAAMLLAHQQQPALSPVDSQVISSSLPYFSPQLVFWFSNVQVIVTAPGEAFKKDSKLFKALVGAASELKGKIIFVSGSNEARLLAHWRARWAAHEIAAAGGMAHALKRAAPNLHAHRPCSHCHSSGDRED